MKKSTLIAVIISIIAFGSLLLYSAFVFISDDSNSETAKTVNSLGAEKKQLEYSLESLRTEMSILAQSGSGIFIMFDHYSDNLKEIAVPVLDEKEYSAILCCQPEESQLGDISELVSNHSWELAIPLSHALSLYNSGLRENSVSDFVDEYISSYQVIPEIACIDSKDYSENESDIDYALRNHGVSALIIKNGDASYDYYSYDGNFLKVSTLEFSISNTIEKALKKRIYANLPTVISIYSIEADDDTVPLNCISAGKFTLMVQTIGTYAENISIGNLGNFSANAVRKFNENSSKFEQLSAKKAEYEGRLNEICEELDRLLNAD